MKTLAAVITAFLVSAVLLVVSAPANAAYPKSVSTVCFAAGDPTSISHTVTPKIAFHAKPSAGNAKVTGKVRFKFIKNGIVVRTGTRSYGGGLVGYKFQPLKRGKYSVVATLVTPASSVFKGCRDGASLKVS
jgi:hypothetical protein